MHTGDVAGAHIDKDVGRGTDHGVELGVDFDGGTGQLCWERQHYSLNRFEIRTILHDLCDEHCYLDCCEDIHKPWNPLSLLLPQKPHSTESVLSSLF